jgi:hypothetical protein
LEGATLLAGILSYTFLNYYVARREFKKLMGKANISRQKLTLKSPIHAFGKQDRFYSVLPG